MDLPRAFIPEARRLLKLARDDRRAAERELAALADSDDETMLRAARALDPEMLVLFLRNHVDVTLKPSEQEDPDWSPPDSSQTLEGQFYFVAKDPKDDIAPLLHLLHTLFQGDYWLYFRAIQAVKEEMTMENEEWALRWRTGRLEDLGFPSWDESMRIYGFLRPERLAVSYTHLRAHET